MLEASVGVGKASESLTGWYVGFVIAAVLITVVVILVAVILRLAQKIGEQANAITLGLDDCRANTMALWNVQIVDDGIKDITRSATQVREILEERT